MHRNSDDLHLELSGDFDGTSAHELLWILKNQSRGALRIFINTNGLKRIHPFGQAILRSGLSGRQRKAIRIVYSGNNGVQLPAEADNEGWTM